MMIIYMMQCLLLSIKTLNQIYANTSFAMLAPKACCNESPVLEDDYLLPAEISNM